MKVRYWYYAQCKTNLALTVLIVLFSLFSLNGCATKASEGVQPTRKAITEAVYCTATLAPKSSYDVYSSVNGVIESSNLQEGLLVKKGDELVRIYSEREELEQERARQLYISAANSHRGNNAILLEMEKQLVNAKLKVTNDSLVHARQSRLWGQNIGSRQAFETAELNFLTSKNRRQELRKTYLRTRRELSEQVDLAGTALRISQQRVKDYVTRAKLSGTVYEVMKVAGESVTPQTPIARIGSTADFIIELLVDEVDIARVTEGQTAVLILDAYENQPFETRVTRILPHKDSRSQTFIVEAEFIDSPKRLYDGLSGEANIIVSRKMNALTLPTELIGPENTVNTQDGERQVEIGLSDLRFTEILSGIDTTDHIFPSN